MLSKISESLDSLSNAERKVAECALSEPKWFVHAAVAEIAEQAQVSQPTVIRFCRSLGYKGLPEFKLALSASISQNGLPFVHAELNTDDNMGDVMEKVLGNTAAALLGARRSLDENELENAIAMLSHARRIEFYGVGNSGIVAQDAQHKFFRFGVSTVAYSDTHIQLMAAAVLTAQDVLVVISNSGSSIELLDAVSIAKESGQPAGAVCRLRIGAGGAGRRAPLFADGVALVAAGGNRHLGDWFGVALGRNRFVAVGKRQAQHFEPPRARLMRGMVSGCLWMKQGRQPENRIGRIARAP